MMLLAGIVAFCGLISISLSLDAHLVFHCDNSYKVSVSYNDGSTFQQIADDGGNQDWHLPHSVTLPSVTYNTVIDVDCQDLGVIGGFIATISYDGQEYYTDNPLSNSNWEVVSSSDGITSPLVYHVKGSSPWNINTVAINSAADWVWNNQVFNTMKFRFDFGNIINSCDAVCGPNGGDCNAQSWAVFKDGLYWAWASPCSGGCSKITYPIPYGWRRATDDEFYNIGPPTAAEFGCVVQPCTDPNSCAAYIFDPKYNHCDPVNQFIHIDDNSYLETVLVHDPCDSCPLYEYIADGTPRTYAEAQAYCDANHHGLATIVTQYEFDCARNIVGNNAAWIGLQSATLYNPNYLYLDNTQCPIAHNGKWGQCVPSPWWEYKGKDGSHPGRPRCPRTEQGSQCVNIDKYYVDNDIQCAATLNAILCNEVPPSPI